MIQFYIDPFDILVKDDIGTFRGDFYGEYKQDIRELTSYLNKNMKKVL